MAETCRDIYDNKSQLLHQVGTSSQENIIKNEVTLFHNIFNFLRNLSEIPAAPFQYTSYTIYSIWFTN
jgi:hypothetical protein